MYTSVTVGVYSAKASRIVLVPRCKTHALHSCIQLWSLLTICEDVAHVILTLPVMAGPFRTQDFEKAGSLRDREMELKAQIQAITGAAKEESAAEAEAEGVGPLVTDQDIANIVSQWTGIPVEKACCLLSKA